MEEKDVEMYRITFGKADLMPHEIKIVEQLNASMAETIGIDPSKLITIFASAFCAGMGIMARRAEIAAMSAGRGLVGAGISTSEDNLRSLLTKAVNEHNVSLSDVPKTLN